MKILIGTPYLSSHFDSGLFWAKSFSELGHFVDLWDYRMNPYNKVSGFDLVIIFKGESIDPEILPRPRICYYPDDPNRIPGIENKLKLYDLVLTPVRPTPEGYEWLPTGWDESVHRDMGYKGDRYEAVYIGTNNSDRKSHWITKLAPDVVFGNGWGTIEPKHAIIIQPPVYHHDLTQALNKAYIAIDIHHGEVGVNRKLFEMIPCTFTLVDRVPGVEEIFGEVVTPLMSFRTVKDARDMIKYYLKNESERKEVWKAQKEKIQPYTYKEAAKKVLSFLK